MTTQRHPEPDVLAAFAEGNLRGEELAAVAGHLEGCDDCRSAVAAAAEFTATEKGTRFHPAWWLAVAAAILAVFVLVPRWRDPLRDFQRDPFRTHQARVTAFAHAPFRVERASSGEPDYRKAAAAADLQERVKKDPTAENLHRFALAELALGRASSAARMLEEARTAAPQNASIASDLAAAQIESGHPADAAETASRALELDPSLSAAAFNLALALEDLANRPAAVKAWERYLTLDGTSPWAAEAREHLQRLRTRAIRWDDEKERLTPGADDDVVARIVGHFPQRARSVIQNDLLIEWVRDGRPDVLALARRVAQLRSARGDHFLADVVDQASPRSETLREAFDAYAKARAIADRREADAAVAAYDRASALLRRAGSPMWLVAAIFASTQDFYAGHGDRSMERLESVEPQLPADRYPSIAAEAEWVRGLVRGREGRFSESLAAYERALAHARRASENEHETSLLSLIAGAHERIADRSLADESRRNALRQLDATDSSPARLYTAYAASVRAALAAGRPRLALTFAESQAALAARENDPLLIAESLTARASALRELDRSEPALRALAEATRISQAIPTAGLRERTISDIEYARAVIESATNPCRSAARFQTTIETWQRRGWRIREVAGRAERADALARCGDRAGAEQELRTGAAILESRRSAFDEPAMRLSYFEHASAVFDRLTRLLIEDGRSAEAFDTAERKRARSLLDRLGDHDRVRPPLATWEELAKLIPGDVLIIQYAVLGDQIHGWCARPKELAPFRLGATRAAVERAIERNDGRWLFDVLVASVPAAASWKGRLVIVPDGPLHRLAFASLVAPDGTYAVEKWPMTIAPSTNAFLRLRQRSPRPSALLAMGVADGDAPRLPRADDELREVAALYPRSEVLMAGRATRHAFLAEATNADTIHFAGHATMADGLLLAGRGGHLAAREVAAMNLPRRPIVVLAACRTAAGKSRAAEGVDSVAVAFLHAGARAVIASLWDLDDRAAAHLSSELHRALARGESPADAVRGAQLSLLRSGDPELSKPGAWAGIVTIGSV